MNITETDLSIEQWIEQGLAMQAAGAIDSARHAFNYLLTQDPNNAVAHYTLAAIDANTGELSRALNHCTVVLARHPKFAPAHFALSVIQFKLDNLDEALVAVDDALSLEPELPNAREHKQAIKVAMDERQKLAVTGKSAADPDPQLRFLFNEGVSLQACGEHEKALDFFQKALILNGHDFPTLYSMGLSLSRLGRLAEALNAFNLAATVHPTIAVAQFAVAKVLQDMGLAEDSLKAYDKAIALDPSYMEAYNSKAALLQSINRHHDALLTLVKASEINPNHARSLEGQGLLLTQYKQYEWATNAFLRAGNADPEYPYIQGNLMSARLHNCDWTDFELERDRIFEGIRSGKRVCSPHTIMALTGDAHLAQRCIEIYAEDKYGPSMYTLWKGETYAHRRKRVAFISGDFRTHPVGYLLIGMIEQLDKRRFELTGVFTGTPDGSTLWQRYRCAFEHYICADGKPSLEVAQWLRSMEIDIAIDLSGYTEGSRLDILSHRPAPIQMSYLGFPGTLSLPFIDFLIADPVTIPPQHLSSYREKILYLPHCYLPRDVSVRPSDRTLSRTEFGLPEKGLVFCCFNHDYKINPPMFKVWMDLLKAVPGSVLWLMKLNETAHVNLAKSAQAHGVDPNRMVFATRLPAVEDHLARYRLADLFLDTYPYTGHTTVGDALLAGLPTVTMAGTSFASRVALSLFNDLRLETGVSTSYEGYFEQALSYAKSETLRQTVMDHLRERHRQGEWPIRVETQAEAFMNLLQ